MQVFFWMIFDRFKVWIIGAGAFAAALLGVYLKGRSDGKDKADRKLSKEVEKNVQLKRKIEQDINSSSGDYVDKRLRNRWSRD